MDYYFQGTWRMDWGLGNPNKTGALIASFMIAIWTLPLIKRWLFWVALPLFAGLGICLIHTMSRGAFLAALSGLSCILWYLPRPWPRNRLRATVVSLTVILVSSVILQTSDRFARSYRDRSITNRLDVWKAVPQMIADAPNGWGIGNSGHAYSSWYQPLDRTEEYRTLVNSHLTWLVEFGWGGRLLYLTVCLSIVIICLPDRLSRFLAIPFGVWLAFFVSSFFSSIAESIQLWIVPGAFLLASLIYRFKTRLWPQRKSWYVPPALAASAVFVAYATFSNSGIHKKSQTIIIGTGEVDVWVVADSKILGKQYPRTLRSSLSKLSGLTIGIVEDANDLPTTGLKRVVLSGNFASQTSNELREKLLKSGQIVVLNPSIPAEVLSLSERNSGGVTIFIGEFSRFAAPSSWALAGDVKRLPGVGDFLPNWPDYLGESPSIETL